MAQQTDGYLKLYTYKSTDTDTQFRDFREQIAGYQIDNIESNFEKLDEIYTSQTNTQIIKLTNQTTTGTVQNIFGAVLTDKIIIKNNSCITVKLPETFPSEIASTGNVWIAYEDVITNKTITCVGTLAYYNRNGEITNVSLSDLQINGVYTLIYLNPTNNEIWGTFIVKDLKNYPNNLANIAVNNILAKDTDYSFKDTGIPYTDVLTKPALANYTDDTLIVKNSIGGQPIISGTSIQQDNVYLCDGTRDLTNPTIIKKIDLLSPTNRNRLNLRWNDSEGSILGYIGDYGVPGGTEEQQFLSISKANGCVNKFIYKGDYVNKDGQNAKDGSGANIPNLSYRAYRVFTVPGGAIIDIRWSSGNNYIDSSGGKVIGTFSNIKLSSPYKSWGWVARTDNGVWQAAQVQLDLHTDGTIEAIGAPFSWRRMSLFTFIPQQVMV